jgi:hypothetical protein
MVAFCLLFGVWSKDSSKYFEYYHSGDCWCVGHLIDLEDNHYQKHLASLLP